MLFPQHTGDGVGEGGLIISRERLLMLLAEGAGFVSELNEWIV